MSNILDKVQTVILVMFENRSFDHMLGHITLDEPTSKINGLRKPLTDYSNIYKGHLYPPFQIDNDSTLESDIPHEYDYVTTQIAKSPVNNKFQMTGFVEAYAKFTNRNPNPECEPMGYFNSHQVPITDFLAKNFCTCNRWHSALPTSTQPNRTIAFCGDSSIHETATRLIPIEDSLFDWMERAGINWRVYHDGLSFFLFYKSLWKYVLSDKFRRFKHFTNDMLNEPQANTPQVIIIEPTYQDAPQIGSNHPNDNHAPLAIGWGEDFLRRTYEAVTANKQKFGKTVMITYYDEHGGFYDHVPPPNIKYITKSNPSHTFESLGPRIPGIIVSPFVKPGSVNDSLFDHTSVLQFLAEKFTPGIPYNKTVEERSKQTPAIESITKTLTNESYWEPPLSPAQPIDVKSALGLSIHTYDSEPMAQSFAFAANELLISEPEKTNEKYPEIAEWQNAVSNRKDKI